MSITLKFEGARELEQALLEIKAVTAKTVVNRVLKRAAEPIQAKMGSLAPDDPKTQGKGDLKNSISISTGLTRKLAGKNRYDRSMEAHVYVGVSKDAEPYVKATVAEWGSYKQVAKPFARPAWDATKDEAWQIILRDLADEIEKAAKSARKRGTTR